MLDELDLCGLSTLHLNDLVERFITVDLGARPASKGQYGFKYVLNCSINHVVCHGVPDPDEIIRDGDIINLDITLEKNGLIADSSKTSLVGNAPGGTSTGSGCAGSDVARDARERIWGILASQLNDTPKRTTARLCGNTVVMALVARCMKNHRC